MDTNSQIINPRSSFDIATEKLFKELEGWIKSQESLSEQDKVLLVERINMLLSLIK